MFSVTTQSNRSIFYFFIAVFLVLCSSPAYGSYSRNVSFGITQITYNELSQLIDKTHNFVERANAKPDAKIGDEILSIGDGKRTIKLKNQINLTSVKELPEVSYFVIYTISSNDTNAPITSVEFEFRDYSRILKIEGNNSDEVDALFSLLRDEIDKYSYFIGGPQLRIFGGVAFFALLSLIPLLYINAVIAGEIAKKTVFLAIIAYVIALIALSLLPFDKWLPGFTVYNLNSSFLVKYSPLFTFLSFIAIPIPFIAKASLSRFKKRKEDEQRTERIETKIDEAIQKVEEIKKSPSMSSGDILIVDEAIKKLAEEFFSNKDIKMLSKKQTEVNLEIREIRLNAEWRPVYLFLINGLIMLLESYNNRLPETDEISFTLPELPSNIFSAEIESYSGTVKFSSDVTMSISFSVTIPHQKDLVPNVFINISSKSDSRQRALFLITIDPENKTIQSYIHRDGMGVGINTDKCELANENYKSFILEMWKKIIEFQLIR